VQYCHTDAFMASSTFAGQALTVAPAASQAHNAVSMKLFDWKRRERDDAMLGECLRSIHYQFAQRYT
jgi:hypothetical protein